MEIVEDENKYKQIVYQQGLFQKGTYEKTKNSDALLMFLMKNPFNINELKFIRVQTMTWMRG